MMAKVLVNPDTTLTYPYTFSQFKRDYPGQSYPADYFTNPAYDADLEALNIFDVVDNPPVRDVDWDPATQRIEMGVVLFVDPDYVLQYTIVDLTADEIDDIDSRGADWVIVGRRFLNNTNSPYRQLQTWAADPTKTRYYNYATDLVLALTLKKVKQFRNILTALKLDLGADSFTAPQINEINRLVGFLGKTWEWADL